MVFSVWLNVNKIERSRCHEEGIVVRFTRRDVGQGGSVSRFKLRFVEVRDMPVLACALFDGSFLPLATFTFSRRVSSMMMK